MSYNVSLVIPKGKVFYGEVDIYFVLNGLSHNQLFLDLNQQLQRINANLWVNMFSSFVENKLDLANDNLHPGPKSHNKLADSIITHITR